MSKIRGNTYYETHKHQLYVCFHILYRLSTVSNNGNIELLPAAITKLIQHSWLEVEDHLKQAGNIMFIRYIHDYMHALLVCNLHYTLVSDSES